MTSVGGSGAGAPENQFRIGKDLSGPSDRDRGIGPDEGAQIMSAVGLQLVCVAGLLGLAVLAIALSRGKHATAIIYGATMVISLAALSGSIHFSVPSVR